MACLPCNTPASDGDLPATTKAYLTDPASAPADSCSSVPVNPCSPPTSWRQYLVDYIPGWLLKLTPATKGKMIVGVGSILHYFKGENPGPLYFDGEDVTVGEQPILSTKANELSIIEKGFLTLARKVKRGKVMPNGSVVDVEYYEHGVQAIEDVHQSELLGLTTDCTSGASRVDVIEPEIHDLIKSGLPKDFKRLGFSKGTKTNGCAIAETKDWKQYTGAVFGNAEILPEYLNGGLPAILVPRNEGGEKSHVLGTQKFTPVDGVTTEAIVDGEYRIPVVKPVYGDLECPDKVTAYITEYIPFPTILTSNFDPGNTGKWVPCVPTLLGSWTTTSTGVIDISELVDVPVGAYAASIECYVEISDSGITRNSSLHAYTPGSFDGSTTVPVSWYVRAKSASEGFALGLGVSYGYDNSIGPCPLNEAMEIEYHYYLSSPNGLGELRVTGFFV